MSRFTSALTLIFALAVSVDAARATRLPGIRGRVTVAREAQAGVQVELYVDDGNSILDSNDTAAATTLTDKNGSYLFSDLDPTASYFVMVDDDVSPLQSVAKEGQPIDTFESTQSAIADPTSGPRMDSMSGSPASILGGHRDLFVEVLDGVAEAKLRANPYSINSNLQIDMSAGVIGRAVVTWDGVAGMMGATPDAGLDSDFTGGGGYEGILLRLAIDAAGDGQTLELLVHSHGAVSRAEIAFPFQENVEPLLAFIPFEVFQGDADLTRVSAFQLIIDNTKPSIDAQIDFVSLAGPSTVNFESLPEPATPLWMLWTILGIYSRRHRRSR